MDTFPEMSSSLTSDERFDTYAAAREKLSDRLEAYQPQNNNDDTVHFLRRVFRSLPVKGMAQLANDAESCDHDNKLRKLVKRLDRALLRPMMATGGRTPGMSPLPCLDVEGSLEDLRDRNFQSATGLPQAQGFGTLRYHGRPRGAYTSRLKAAHIIPLGLGNLRADGRRRHAQFWTCLYRYFPTIHNLFHYGDEDVNRLDNIIMLDSVLHEEFGHFNFVLEETDVSDRYRVKVFSLAHFYIMPHLPEFVTITSHDPQCPAPNKYLLAVHAAIGKMLHATGRGELVAKIMKHLDDSGGHSLARDGSSDVEELLSVTCLSSLAIDSSDCESAHEEKQPGHVGSWLPGAQCSTFRRYS
ncbi:hypothetical protein N7470_002632 [Penicillium chermesinum]|nr:hypothetical protein N7470_002632 [Penicillium chermesinum]